MRFHKSLKIYFKSCSSYTFGLLWTKWLLVTIIKLWVKFSAEDNLKFSSSIFPMKHLGFDISCKPSPTETSGIKCQVLLPGKHKSNIINLSSVEYAQRVVKVNKYYIYRINPSIRTSKILILRALPAKAKSCTWSHITQNMTRLFIRQ